MTLDGKPMAGDRLGLTADLVDPDARMAQPSEGGERPGASGAQPKCMAVIAPQVVGEGPLVTAQ